MSATRRELVVSLDGPGSSGKSSVGAAAAERLRYRFCDTGVLYRGLTWLALQRDVASSDEDGLVTLVPAIELAADGKGRYMRLLVNGEEVTSRLHTTTVDARVSEVSRNAAVRAALLPLQRSLAAAGGIIMAGRDIGTVVLPDADLKLYLDVSIEERARRRAADRGVAPDSEALVEIEAELRRRDGLDTNRTVAPLRIPDGAMVIHADGNTLEQTVERVVAIISTASRNGGRSGG
jgi:cytidylate kinase